MICAALLTACKHENADQEMAEGKSETMTIGMQDITLTMAYPATLRGSQDIAILPQVEGKIEKVLIEEGQTVRKGQTLFVIDQVAQRAALNTAIANEHAAKAVWDNAYLSLIGKEKLKSEKVVSDFTVSQMRHQVAQAKAQWELAHAEVVNARNSLSYTVVKSPSNGVVGSLPHKIGALVSPTMSLPLTYISDNAEMIAYFSLNQDQITALLRKYGSKENALKQMPAVSWQMNDGSNYESKGKVVTISGLLDQQTGTVSVRAAFSNDNRLLLSGATGNVLMPTIIKNAVVIPQTAVNELQDKYMVKKMVGGKEKLTEIKIYPLNDGKTYVVTDGLKKGDVIIKK